MSVSDYLPYCGAPPIPGHVTWNTDPVLAAALGAFAALYALGAHRHRIEARWRVCFWSGWTVLTLALVSPLCNLSVALFSARIAQHVILTLVAAPLLVLGRLERIWPVPRPALMEASAAQPSVSAASSQWAAVLVFALVMWLWHVPAAYDATFESTLIYWTMHVTMIGAAVLFWTATLRAKGSISSALTGIFATMLQMSLLGALLTFARTPLFAVHADTTWPWGLSQLGDQQLGGLIMWVVGGIILASYGALALASYLTEEQPIVR